MFGMGCRCKCIVKPLQTAEENGKKKKKMCPKNTILIDNGGEKHSLLNNTKTGGVERIVTSRQSAAD